MKIMLLLITVFLYTIYVFPQSEKEFFNYGTIKYKDDHDIVSDSTSVLWGRNLLHKLNTQTLSNSEKAKIIERYLYKEFKYNFKRRINISEIVNKKGGNCVSHAITGIFLLRLAGVPAKFVHEVHIMKEYTILSLLIGRDAKKNNNGINSYWHNDHVWVLYFDGKNWEPFDSALGIAGIDEFFDKRFHKHRELSDRFVEKWTGPPFCLWEDSGFGLDRMENVTDSFLKSLTLKTNSEEFASWFVILNSFDDWSKEDFYREYLDSGRIEIIKKCSRKLF